MGGNASVVIAKKLKLVQEELKGWKEEVFGDVKVKNYDLMGTSLSFDLEEEYVGLTSDEVDQRKSNSS